MRNIVILLFGLLIAGCDLTDSGDDSVDDTGDDTGAVTAEFVVKDKFGQEVDSFTAGELIVFEMTVRNTTDEDVTYQTTAPGFVVKVMQDQNDIWSTSPPGVGYLQVIEDRVIAASDTLLLSVSWTGTDYEGNAVGPGTYLVSPSLDYSVDGKTIFVPEDKMITLH